MDVLEGVNNQSTNQYTFHSSPDCSVDSTLATSNDSMSSFSAYLVGTTCDSSPSDNAGCAFSDPDPRSYGHAFNDIAGVSFSS